MMTLLVGCGTNGAGERVPGEHDHEDHLPGEDGGGVDTAGALCRPGALWLTEEESLDIEILCAREQDAVTGADVVIEPLPDGAVYDPDTARLRWTPALDQAAVYELVARIPQRGESVTLTIGVADAWRHPDNVPIVDREAYPLEYGVPVFFLSPPPEDPEDYAPTTIVYGGRTYEAKAKKRGYSSLAYPKNSYTLKFPRDDAFSEPDWAGGFMNKYKVVLTSSFDDNSYVRQRMAFELWNRLDPEHIQVQHYPAVVYLDDAFWGIYTVTDHVDGDLMEQHGLREDGNLYKSINSDANFRLVDEYWQPKEHLRQGYEKKEGEPEEGPEAFADIVALVELVALADDATFEREIRQEIDMDDYQNWMILAELIAASDTISNNTYQYHDPATPWRLVLWDFNASFGQNWMTERYPSDFFEHMEEESNRLFERFLEIPSLRGELMARYRRALDGVFSADAVLALMDEYLAELQGVIPRDQARWQEAYEQFYRWETRDDITDHAGEVAFMRGWITERWAILEGRYP